MTIAVYWWHIPLLITIAYLVWALWPDKPSGMWGNIEVLFMHIIGLMMVLVSWAVFAIYVLVFEGAA